MNSCVLRIYRQYVVKLTKVKKQVSLFGQEVSFEIWFEMLSLLGDATEITLTDFLYWSFNRSDLGFSKLIKPNDNNNRDHIKRLSVYLFILKC